MSMILGREHNKNRPFCADDYTSAKIVQNFDYAKKKQIKFQTNEIFFIIITRAHHSVPVPCEGCNVHHAPLHHL